jgi:hypothetical protein
MNRKNINNIYRSQPILFLHDESSTKENVCSYGVNSFNECTIIAQNWRSKKFRNVYIQALILMYRLDFFIFSNEIVHAEKMSFCTYLGKSV